MKKVGILSMQRIKNYGSFLQAYALKSIIEQLGNEVEFVDYHIEKPLINIKKQNFIFKAINVLFGQGNISHKIQYLKYKNNIANKYLPILGINDKFNYNAKVDTLVIGSDEVFNCIQKNPNVGYSLELFGKDNNANKVISYAASFGNTTLERIKKYKKENELSSLLSVFYSISVRDTNSGNIINGLLAKEPIYNLDPVLIYDYVNCCDRIPEIKINEKYMVLYAYSNRISKEEAKFIKKYCEVRGVKIYSIGGVQAYADKFIDCNPFEVLGYFKNAEFIITDTFHGTIFSIIYNKPFVTLVRKTVNDSYGNEEKLSDLLNRLHLRTQLIYNINTLDDKMFYIENYKQVNEIILKERDKAINYLKEKI